MFRGYCYFDFHEGNKGFTTVNFFDQSCGNNCSTVPRGNLRHSQETPNHVWTTTYFHYYLNGKIGYDFNYEGNFHLHYEGYHLWTGGTVVNSSKANGDYFESRKGNAYGNSGFFAASFDYYSSGNLSDLEHAKKASTYPSWPTSI